MPLLNFCRFLEQQQVADARTTNSTGWSVHSRLLAIETRRRNLWQSRKAASQSTIKLPGLLYQLHLLKFRCTSMQSLYYTASFFEQLIFFSTGVRAPTRRWVLAAQRSFSIPCHNPETPHQLNGSIQVRWYSHWANRCCLCQKINEPL